MKKLTIFLILSLALTTAYAQEEATDNPVGYTFEAGILIDNQTMMTLYKGMKSFEIHHRFGMVTDGVESLFGIYSTANVRLGVNYGITDRLMVGVGTTRGNKLQDAQVKYLITPQTESGKMPVSIAYYGNVALDGRPDNAFGPEEDYRFVHRISYFNQIIIARKFSDAFSLQVAPTAIYFNSVERGYKNFNYGLHTGGRYAFGMGHAIIFEYDHMFTPQENDEMQPKPQLALGWEKGTGTHAFQLFIANYTGIIGQYNFLYNSNDFTQGDFLVGLNVTVRF